MPSAAPRQVGFAPIPASYSRLPHDDELYVMRAFARHASHCLTCAHPYDVHKKGGSLCPKGHARASDVAQYVFNRAGQAFSIIDLNEDRRVQIEIPSDCSVVRELLKAMERGLRLRRKALPISYDKNYPNPPKIIQADRNQQQQREPRQIRKPTLETSLPPKPLIRTYSRREHERPSHVGRGSLYEADMKEARRLKEQRRHSTYYNVGSRGVLPVPAKDDYYYD